MQGAVQGAVQTAEAKSGKGARSPEQVRSIVLRDAAVATELDGRLRKERVEI